MTEGEKEVEVEEKIEVVPDGKKAVRKYNRNCCLTFTIVVLILTMAFLVSMNNPLFNIALGMDGYYSSLHERIQYIKGKGGYEYFTNIDGMTETVFLSKNATGILYCIFNMTGKFIGAGGGPIFIFPFPNNTNITNYCIKRFNLKNINTFKMPSYYILKIGAVYCRINVSEQIFEGYWLDDQCWFEGKRGGVYMNADSLYSHLIRQAGHIWTTFVPKEADLRTLPLDWSELILLKIHHSYKWILDKVEYFTTPS